MSCRALQKNKQQSRSCLSLYYEEEYSCYCRRLVFSIRVWKYKTLCCFACYGGKSNIFKEFANINVFPICLYIQDTEEVIKAVKYIVPVFGGINLEDISSPRCFEIEARLCE